MVAAHPGPFSSSSNMLLDVGEAEAAAHLEELVRSVGGVVWQADAETLAFDFISAAVEDLLGYPAKRWVEERHFWRDHIHPEDRDRVMEFCRRAIVERRSHEFEYRMIRSDGGITWLRDIVGTGRAGKVRGLMLDITRRKETEAALRESEERFRQLTENIAEVFWIIDAQDQHVLYVSPAFEMIWGWSAAELREGPRKWLESIHPEDRRRVMRRSLALHHDEVFRIVRRDGDIRWIHNRAFPVLNDAGEIYRVVGVAEDVTERRQAEIASRESNERFQLVAQATTDVLRDWDLAGRSVWWSDGFSTQLGYPESGVLPESSWIENIHPDDRQPVLDDVDRAIDAGEERWSGRYRFRKSDGEYIHVLDRGFVQSAGEGRPRRMLGAMVDITRQQQLESQLEQIKRVSSLGTLAASMAHEFNNVLMGIQPFADVIRKTVPDQPRVQHAIERIDQSIARGRKVTGEILQFTRRTEPVRTPVEVGEWLEAFREEAAALLGENLHLEIDVEERKLTMSADVGQLNQVMANLIINAREASPAGGSVKVSARRCSGQELGANVGDDCLRLTVHDDGPGVPRELLDRIFEPLFTTKRKGTGLGLAISHQVVTAHNGRIFANTPPEGGTDLHVLLPLEHTEASHLENGSLQSPRLPRSVLIVDDEIDVAQGLEALLRIEDVEVSMVHRGSEAVNAIRTQKPDVVLLDIALPDMNGVDVFHQIVELGETLRVVFMSGHFSRKELDPLLTRPGVAFLQKPFTRDELIGVLSSMKTTAES